MRIGTILGDVAEHLPLVSIAAHRLRSRYRKDGIPYADWVRWYDTPTPSHVASLRQAARRFRSFPSISLALPVIDTPPEILEDAILSVRQQVYERWDLCIADDASTCPDVWAVLERQATADARIQLGFRSSRGGVSAALNTALGMAGGEYVAFLDEQCLLSPDALYWVAEAINRHPDAALLYSDEDIIDDSRQRFSPHLKCDFNHELLLAQNMISQLGVYRRDVVTGLGGFRSQYDGAHDHDLALRVVSRVDRRQIVHVSRVLYHRRLAPNGPSVPGHPDADTTEKSRLAVADHLRRINHPAAVVPAPESPEHHRIRHPLPAEQPLVSIIICTRDHADLLRGAVESICSKTTYTNYEILIVDNGSQDHAALAYLGSLSGHRRITVLRDDSPFNYSRLNNRAVSLTQGPLVCLLNDDVEVSTADWLEELASQAIRPDVGAVGARLWYPDGTLQHGGVIIGIGGIAGHAHPRLERGSPGYQSRAVLAQELSAVTGACLMVRREVFNEVGGLDERLFVTFNDVDFCLRVRKAGYRNIWTPFAELVHHESASRGQDDTPEKQARFLREVSFMRERWGSLLDHDPFYHPLFSPRAASFVVSPRPSTAGIRNAA